MILKRVIFFISFVILSFTNSHAQTWTGKWITSNEVGVNNQNTWIAFRKIITLNEAPILTPIPTPTPSPSPSPNPNPNPITTTTSIPIRIAADTKYWLWINGKIIIQEGGLKRGPTRTGTYIDSVDIAPYLVKGQNSIAVLLWFFGKSGYSHLSSGKSGLLIQSTPVYAAIATDSSWQANILKSYQLAQVQPNTRLAESSLLYDARDEIGKWQTDYSIAFKKVIEMGDAGAAPWNELISRPIPFFEFSELTNYTDSTNKSGNGIITYGMKLPLNIQAHPYLNISSATGGEKIKVYTNSNQIISEPILELEYITKKGDQEFEFPLWLNGEIVYYDIPSSVKVNQLRYKKSGYATQTIGSFTSSDEYLNILWTKSLNTLHLSMRDNWMDCPDRERAGWTGDVVTQALQAQYTLDKNAANLTSKWYTEFTKWRTPVHDFYSIIPIGNSNIEIPDQTLLLISSYGIEHYLQQFKDTSLINELYPSLKLNFSFWFYNQQGLILPREGGNRWNWGDWGDNVDQLALYNMLYLNSLKTMKALSIIVKDNAGTNLYEQSYQSLRTAIRKNLWRGNFFASNSNINSPDERIQAFAILSGAADSADYPSLSIVLENVLNASPYMEQFVFEALCLIGKQETAFRRFKNRYGSMIRNQQSSTVWEGWQMPLENNLPKTANHGWSGAALYLFPKWIHGIKPLSSGFSQFTVQPFYGKLTASTTTVPNNQGMISSSFTRIEKKINHTIQVPEKTSCTLILPAQYVDLAINGTYYKEKNKLTALGNSQIQFSKDSSTYTITLNAGNWNIELLMNDAEYLQLTSTTLYSDGKALLFYPNPVSSTIYINGNYTQKNVRIFSMEGKLLLKTTINANNNYINVGTIPKGMYILQLEEQNTGKKQSGKFFKL